VPRVPHHDEQQRDGECRYDHDAAPRRDHRCDPRS
jgi:hypothetical protein